MIASWASYLYIRFGSQPWGQHRHARTQAVRSSEVNLTHHKLIEILWYLPFQVPGSKAAFALTESALTTYLSRQLCLSPRHTVMTRGEVSLFKWYSTALRGLTEQMLLLIAHVFWNSGRPPDYCKHTEWKTYWKHRYLSHTSQSLLLIALSNDLLRTVALLWSPSDNFPRKACTCKPQLWCSK